MTITIDLRFSEARGLRKALAVLDIKSALLKVICKPESDSKAFTTLSASLASRQPSSGFQQNFKFHIQLHLHHFWPNAIS